MLPSLSCFSSASCRWFWFVWFFGLDFLPFDLRSHWSMRWYSLEKRRDDTNEGFSLVFPFFFSFASFCNHLLFLPIINILVSFLCSIKNDVFLFILLSLLVGPDHHRDICTFDLKTSPFAPTKIDF